jgi:hypothetical protein
MEMQLALAGSTVLYHLIPMEYAIEAMQKDRFRLMPTNEGVEAEFGTAQYFLSLARSKLSDYFIKEAGSTHVIFVLDGQKMNANYQIKAVDYWASQKHVSNDEKEDRLFANKMYIPCIRYIKEIHFMKESGKYKENESLTLALLAKRNKIPLFQYDDHKAFIRLDKRKTIKLEVSNIKKKKFGKNEWTPGPDYTLEAWYVASQIVFKGDKPHYTQFMAGAKHKEERKARERVARDIRNLIKYRDVEAGPVRDFNQLSGFIKDPHDAEFLEKIKLVKRRLKTDTKGFLDFVRKRWMTQEEREMHGLE